MPELSRPDSRLLDPDAGRWDPVPVWAEVTATIVMIVICLFVCLGAAVAARALMGIG